jgi:hypothetical protein
MVGKIFIFIFLLAVLANIYIFIFFIQKRTSSFLYRIVWFLPSLFLLIALYIVYFSDLETIEKSFFIISFLALTLPIIFFALISCFDFIFSRSFGRRFYPFTFFALIVSFFSFIIILFVGITGRDKITSDETNFYLSNESLSNEQSAPLLNDVRQ